jgi:hypothetical protein
VADRVKPSTSPAGNSKVVPLRPTNEPAATASEVTEGKPGDALSEEQRAAVAAALKFGAEILEVPPTRWLLTGVLPQRGLGALYSKPGKGKSFVAVHLAFEAATGGQFFGEAFPRPLRVVYVAAERESDIRDRIEAQAKHRNIAVPDNLAVIVAPRPWHGLRDYELLRYALAGVAAERWGGAPPDLIVFDTFARMSLGTNENASEEMGLLIEAFGALVKECGEAFGLLVHHEGKDTTKGLRGSSALLGALDVVLRLEPDAQALKVTVEKLNAAPDGATAWFRIIGQPIPDPADPGLDGVRVLRDVGVAIRSKVSEVMAGRGAEVLEALRSLPGGVGSVKEITKAYNEGKATGEAKSSKTIYNHLKYLSEQRPPAAVVEGQGSATRYRIAEPDRLEGLEG